MKKKETTEPGSRPLWPRVIAFLLALIVGVGGITLGVLQIGKKEPGYQVIDTAPDEEVSLYNRGITFNYYFDGGSDEIKRGVKELSGFYSPLLMRVYKLLDAEREYEGFRNIATLNAHIGEDITVGPELFRVLTDAKEKTLEQKGFNMFDGALYRAWQDILYLSEPEDFDPLRNEEQRERLRQLSAAGGDLSNFDLVIVDAEQYVLRLEVSESYLALLRELEQEGPILDLGLLHDAYELQLLTDSLEAAGYRSGFLSMRSGAVSLLSANPAGELTLYGRTADGMAPAAVTPAPAGRATSYMRAVAETEGEAGYYVLDGQLRHPWLTASGACGSVIQAALIVADDPATAAYLNLQLQEAPTAELLHMTARACPAAVAYVLNDAAPTVYANSALFLPCEDYGWTLEPLQ